MAGSQGVRAGRAFVELFANDNALVRTLEKAGSKLKSFGVQSAAVGGAIGAPLAKSFSDALNKGAEIKNLSIQFGETTSSVSTLAGAFNVAGANLENFGGSIDGLKSKIKAAADGNGELVEGLRGLRGRDLINMSLEKQLDTIAERFKDIKLATDQTAVAQDLFGASAAKLLPYLREGAAGLAKLKAEGKKAGEIMSDEDIERSYTASKALNLVWVELKNTVVALGASLLPTRGQTKSVTDAIREAFQNTRAWIAENRNFIIAAAGAAAGLIGLAGAAVGVKLALTAVTTLVSGIGLALGLLLSPVGLVTIAVVGIGTAFLTCTETGRKMTSALGEAFAGMKESFGVAWGGIRDAIKAGDIEGAMQIAGAGIKAIWRELLLGLRKGWNDFVKWMVSIIKDNPMLLPVIGAAVGTAVGGPIGAVAGLAAGTGANFIDFEKHLSADLEAANASVKEAKDELRALVMGRGNKGAAGDQGIIDGAAADAARLKAYEQIKDAGKKLPELFDHSKGVFSGPIGQQLGLGDKIAQRQLDVQQNMDKGIQQVVKGVNDLGKNKAVFGR
ncbi:MAG: hypothetical protein K8U57_12655 [Planctomycetes bacterium]|nr:hypothetical protein [Planctomycetota bacterium]